MAKKKIAVLVRDRQAEALRMAIGLSLQDDEVQVFLMDSGLDREAPEIALNLEMLGDLGIRMVSNRPDSPFETSDDAAIAAALVSFDTVIPY